MTEAKHPEVIYIDKDYFYKIEHSLYEGISFDDKEQVAYILKSKYDEIEKENEALKNVRNVQNETILSMSKQLSEQAIQFEKELKEAKQYLKDFVRLTELPFRESDPNEVFEVGYKTKHFLENKEVCTCNNQTTDVYCNCK